MPCLQNGSKMGQDDSANHIQLPGAEAVTASKLQWLKPELAVPVLALHMNVRWLVAVKTREEEPVRSRNASDSWQSTIAPSHSTVHTIVPQPLALSGNPVPCGLTFSISRGGPTLGAAITPHSRTRRRLHAVLDGGENRPTKPLREFDGCEIARRVEIVLTGLVDHAELIMLGGLAVGQDAINLVPLQ
jgi:hypothetical protein